MFIPNSVWGIHKKLKLSVFISERTEMIQEVKCQTEPFLIFMMTKYKPEFSSLVPPFSKIYFFGGKEKLNRISNH